MNVSALGSAPVPAPVPPVTPPARTSETSADARRGSRDAAARAAEARAAERAAAEQRKAETPKLPPLKPLSTTEIRVILGALPVSHVATIKPSDNEIAGGSFDAYA